MFISHIVNTTGSFFHRHYENQNQCVEKANQLLDSMSPTRFFVDGLIGTIPTTIGFLAFSSSASYSLSAIPFFIKVALTASSPLIMILNFAYAAYRINQIQNNMHKNLKTLDIEASNHQKVSEEKLTKILVKIRNCIGESEESIRILESKKKKLETANAQLSDQIQCYDPESSNVDQSKLEETVDEGKKSLNEIDSRLKSLYEQLEKLRADLEFCELSKEEIDSDWTDIIRKINKNINRSRRSLAIS